MPSIRVCVALMLPSPWREEVDGLRRALGNTSMERIAPHITLIPPVNLNTESLPKALALLRRATYLTHPFTLTVGPVTSFLPHTPVIKLDVGGSDEDALTQFRQVIMKPPLLREVTRPFVPHVTLKHQASPDQIQQAEAALSAFRAEMFFDRVHLLQEIDRRAWTPIADMAFAAPAIVGRGGLELELALSHMVDPVAAALLENDIPESNVVITAYRQQEPVGVLAGTLTKDLGRLQRIAVREDSRLQGVGSQMVKFFASEAAKSQALWLQLDGAEAIPGRSGETCPDRTNFFAKMGFQGGRRALPDSGRLGW